MSYLALARKYRPKTFEDLYGQQGTIRILENEILNEKISNAYLFTGPRGIGKTSVARLFARALNCLEGQSVSPCGKCSNCTEIHEGQSIDVLEIDGASNRGIGDIKVLRSNINYAPTKCRYKIYIIDEVHMLSTDAFNGLLKTLEEPPPHTIFIFATTDPHKIPATIVSRCQRFDLKKISVDTIIERLTEISGHEGIQIDENALYMIAKKSDGALRDAITLLDQISSYKNENIEVKDVQEILGLIDLDVFFEITGFIISRDDASLLLYYNEIIGSGFDLKEFVNGLIEHFRNLLIYQISANAPKIIKNPPDYTDRYKNQSEAFTKSQIYDFIEIISELRKEIQYASQPVLITEVALLKLTRIENILLLNDILNEIEMLSAKLEHLKSENITINTESDKGVAEEKEKELCFNEIKSGWKKFAASLSEKSIMLSETIKHAKPLALENNELEIECDEYAYNKLSKSPVEFNGFLKEWAGAGIRHKLKLVKTPKKPEAANAAIPVLKKPSTSLSDDISQPVRDLIKDVEGELI